VAGRPYFLAVRPLVELYCPEERGEQKKHDCDAENRRDLERNVAEVLNDGDEAIADRSSNPRGYR